MLRNKIILFITEALDSDIIEHIQTSVVIHVCRIHLLVGKGYLAQTCTFYKHSINVSSIFVKGTAESYSFGQ